MMLPITQIPGQPITMCSDCSSMGFSYFHKMIGVNYFLFLHVFDKIRQFFFVNKSLCNTIQGKGVQTSKVFASLRNGAGFEQLSREYDDLIVFVLPLHART